MYKGKRVTIMGLGLFGGGAGAARFFVERGAHVTVTDKKEADALTESLVSLRCLPIRYVLGRHEPDDFRNADLVCVNPDVTLDNPFVAMARGAGAQIENSMDLLFKLTPRNPKIGVTGSNGKSTTTAYLGEILRLHNPRTLVGGNIGKCLLCETAHLAAGAPVVLELSSFMLEWMQDSLMSPQIAIVTNLSPNHLNRHRTMENYAAAKQTILKSQKSGDVAVLNDDDPEVRTWDRFTQARVVRFSVKQEPQGDGAFLAGEKLIVRTAGREDTVAARETLRLPGNHNVANALAAAAAAMSLGAQPWHVTEALGAFSGLPHRLEMVARGPQAVRYYNDSIATTPESVICALAALSGPVTLIAGGSGKGCPLDELGIIIARRVRRLILMGATGPMIQEAVLRAKQALKCGPVILHARDLEQAVQVAARDAAPGEAILLSPAAASFDMFRNFEERGECFRVLARRTALSAG